MKKVGLKVFVREGEKPKKIRREGFIPAIVYGGHKKPLGIKIREHDFIHLLHTIHGENIMIELRISRDGKEKKELAILKEVQRDPLMNRIIHADFLRVSLKETLEVEVPVVPVGEAKGVKEGGILEIILRHIRVEALPQDLPEHLEVDISNLEVGDTLHVGDITPPPGVKILTHPEETILTIVPPRVVEEVVAVAPEEVVEEAEMEEKEEKVEEEKEEKEEED